MGTFGGREIAGIPKKVADQIYIKRTGDYVRAYIERKGVRFIDCEVNNGKYNNAAAASVFGDVEAGLEVLLRGFFYKYDVNKNEEGKVEFSDGRLNQLVFDTTYDHWEKGTTTIKLENSIEDPWAELEVIEVLGAGYCKNNIDLAKGSTLAEVDINEVLPYLMAGRFDKGVMNKHDIEFKS